MTRYSAWLVVLGSSLWATDTLFRRPLTGVLSPVTIVLLEHCCLALATVPVLWRRRSEFQNLGRREYASLLFVALGGSVAATVLFTFAVKYGNPSVAVLLQKSQPLFTVVLARFALGERPAKWFWPCLAFAVGGACLMSFPNLDPGRPPESSHSLVMLCAVAAAGLWGGATVCGRYLVSRVSTAFLTGLRFLLALPALLLLYGLQPTPQRSLTSDWLPLAAVAGMALISGLLSLLIYYRGLRSTTASVASICELAFPITAIAVTWLILNISLSAVQLLGSAILVASVTTLAWMHTARSAGIPVSGSKPIGS